MSDYAVLSTFFAVVSSVALVVQSFRIYDFEDALDCSKNDAGNWMIKYDDAKKDMRILERRYTELKAKLRTYLDNAE